MLSLGAISKLLGGKLIGDPHVEIPRINDLDHATASQLSFFSNVKYSTVLHNTRAAAVIVLSPPDTPVKCAWICVDNVYLALAQVS
ncbi:MAG TPA: UDP-3-O-(3-hydroxymyristoyl)glucosamine N-acyltransferase, partial [Myxococcales bacterium]|nr:UDP-3-O-(3-hydroxymyristoyl)glucosamine N-acyltransferase [Myxococcales bacterium]